MSFLKDKMKQKLQHWKQTTLSHGGKEILIKAVVSDIPTYIMSCFKLPKKMFGELNKVMAKFWWRQGGKDKAIHWKSWKAMTERKEEGGMNFKELESFNIAMLAKQGWRIMQEPNALWVKILKGLYFSDRSFLESRKGAQASWCWSSIWEAKKTMERNGIWQIGDGRNVSIWNDRWIPDKEGILKPKCVGGINFPGRVEEWIDREKGEWDWEAIGEWIDEEEKELLKHIPVSKEGEEDRFVWARDRLGRYTVKGGYKVIKGEMSRKENRRPSSSFRVDKKIWKETWRLEVPNKLRNFLWRVCSNILATRENLKKREIVENDLCPLCWQEKETMEHLFFQCEWTRLIWFAGCFGMHIDETAENRIEEWLAKMLVSKDVQKKVKERLTYTLW